MKKTILIFSCLFILGLTSNKDDFSTFEGKNDETLYNKNLFLKKGRLYDNIDVNTKNIDSVEILKKIVLPKIINETSGLEFYKNNFITHNDSGGESSLYVFNNTGDIVSIIDLNKDSSINVRNDDWEDLTSDNEFLFIANTGNNFGYRKDLALIRVNKKDNFKVDGIIRISYSNQDSFFPRFKHKHDAEALLIIDDKIALFTKDRDSLNTDLYLIDKYITPQKLTSKINYKVKSLITGGDFNADLNLLALVGYNQSEEQFLILFDKFDKNNLANNKFKKYKIPLEKSQIEAIKIIDNNTFWITSEDEGIGNPYMYKIKVE